MTGYGRGRAQAEGQTVRAEMRAVNHRFLDISMRLPPYLMQYETEIRRLISSRVARGRIEVSVAYETDGTGAGARLNVPLAAAYIRAAADCAREFGIENDLTAAVLLSQPDMLLTEPSQDEESTIRPLIRSAVSQALDALEAARAAEGAQLLADMLERVKTVESLAALAQSRADAAAGEYRKRLAERVEALLQTPWPEPGRLEQEVVLLADRCDVTEELVRIKSHLEQFRQRCRAEDAVGRSLDFLLQELNREFNTIGSKSQDAAIGTAVVDAKAELERIREQVQNIE